MPKLDCAMSSSREPYPRPMRSTARAVCMLAIALLAALMAMAIASGNAKGHGQPWAHAARALNVTDTAHLHYVKQAGSQLIDEGAATGTLPGTVRVSFNAGVTMAATFTIYAHGWSIVGHGSGALHKSNNKKDVDVSFGGTMTVSHGTGRYAHAHGTGGFYGVIDRTNYAVTIQTTGTLSY
jgi:hypothetical protein